MVGAAIISFDGKPEDITDPTIGELKFYYKEYDLELDPNSDIYFNEVKTRPCVASDFP